MKKLLLMLLLFSPATWAAPVDDYLLLEDLGMSATLAQLLAQSEKSALQAKQAKQAKLVAWQVKRQADHDAWQARDKIRQEKKKQVIVLSVVVGSFFLFLLATWWKNLKRAVKSLQKAIKYAIQYSIRSEPINIGVAISFGVAATLEPFGLVPNLMLAAFGWAIIIRLVMVKTVLKLTKE